MRAYRKTRVWLNEAPAREVAAVEAAHFPQIDQDVLTQTIATYQKLGCWAPEVEITREAFEVTLDVFRNIGRSVPGDVYSKVIAPPPA